MRSVKWQMVDGQHGFAHLRTVWHGLGLGEFGGRCMNRLVGQSLHRLPSGQDVSDTEQGCNVMCHVVCSQRGGRQDPAETFSPLTNGRR